MFENYLYATNSDNANAQQKTSVIRVNRFNSTDYQVVTRVDKGGALHIYHQRRQPRGEQSSPALPGAPLWEPLILSCRDCFSYHTTPLATHSSDSPFLPLGIQIPPPGGPFSPLPRTQSAPPVPPLVGLEEKPLAWAAVGLPLATAAPT